MQRCCCGSSRLLHRFAGVNAFELGCPACCGALRLPVLLELAPAPRVSTYRLRWVRRPLGAPYPGTHLCN